MSSQYNNNIAQAIDILLNKRLSELHYDQTIIAEICEIVDEEAGKYKIQYESVILNAESTDPSKRYKLNRSVYVKVPKSDFSQKLLIESAVDSEGSATAAALKELKNYRIPQTPIFEYPGTLSLIAGPKELEDGTANLQNVTLECFESYENEKELQFRALAEKYEVFKVEAKFLIGFQGQHYQGNYGLRFEFLTTDSQQDISTKVYTLDTASFTGNYFSHNPSGSRQYAFFQVPKGTLKALKSVTLFQDGIEQDTNPNSPIKINGQIVGYKKIKNTNISVTEIKLTFYDIADLTNKNNYLHLQAPNGYYGENLEFSVQLLNQGENILKPEEHSIFWYEKKLENNDEKSLAGEGWVLKNEDSSSSFKIENISAALTYKVIIFNKDNIKLAEKEFVVQPFLEFVVPSIVETVGVETVELSMPNGYIADWSYNDNFIEKQKSITLSADDFINQTIKVECEIYQADNRNFVGHNNIIVNAPAKIEDVQINFNGIETYQYDANGSIFLEEANIEREMIVATIMNEERTNNIENFEFFLGDYQITDNKEDWKQYAENINSLLDSIYYSQNEYGTYIIHYKVKTQYDDNKNNNTFICRINFKDFESVKKEKTIHFVKVGDLGTNDTTDNCILTPVLNNEIWNVKHNRDYLININVYSKGVKITDNNDRKYKIINIILHNSKGEHNYLKHINYNQQIVVSKEDLLMDDNNYIYLEIELNDKRIKSYYGIPVGSGYLVADRPTNYIKYNADGKNPQYKNSVNNPLIPPEFDFEQANNKGYYFINHTVNNVLYPIICYTNTYGNNAINSWNGEVTTNIENKTLLATQIVAGSRGNSLKDSPKFTGIIAGKIQDDTKKLNGLYGYKDNPAPKASDTSRFLWAEQLLHFPNTHRCR